MTAVNGSNRLRLVLRLVVAFGTGSAVLAAGIAPAQATPLKSWRNAHSVNVGAGGYQSLLVGIDCVSPTWCFAVGKGVDASGVEHTLTESWNGSTWKVVPSPDAGTGDDELHAVSCASKSRCVAVGYSLDEESDRQPLAEVWDGKTWQVTASVNPNIHGGGSGASSQLDGVSCASVLRCVAVGGQVQLGSGVRRTLVETWSKGTWAVSKSPSPSAKTSNLVSVSCPDVAHCMAVGTAVAANGFAVVTLAERMVGTAWTTTPTPNGTPANGSGIPSNLLLSVSCTSKAYCQAVGQFHDVNTADDQTLVETWTGHHWVRTPSANKPQGANNDSDFSAVSCARAWACSAVGSYAPNGPFQTLVETWNGGRWGIRSSPDANPTNVSSTPNELLAVSCPTPTYCMAVGHTEAGWTPTGNMIQNSLAEVGPAVVPRIVLQPSRQTHQLGSRRCVAATVTDGYGGRIVGIPVKIKVTGADRLAATEVTNGSGAATICIVGKHVGSDHVAASVELAAPAQATMTWTAKS